MAALHLRAGSYNAYLMTCPDCGTSAPPASRFCPQCGTRLVEPGRTVSAAEMVTMETPQVGVRGSPVAQPPLAGEAMVAGRYRIVRLLGRGGMGEVYEAYDERLRQTVALKIFPATLAADPDQIERFHAEVRLARLISHPNVGRVYDIVQADGRLCLSMELIDGEDLASRLARTGRYEGQAAVDVSRQICAGLAAIHEEGVLHRDLKPANIMLDRQGRPHVCDFGLATADRMDNVRAGTPAYMAPEQLLGEPLSVKTDLYALGLVLYEISTGERALGDRSLDDLVTHHRTGAPVVPPGSHHAGIDATMDRAIAACLARDPAARPTSALDVLAMLHTVIIDGRSRARRILQQATPMAGAFLMVAGMVSSAVTGSDSRIWALLAGSVGAIVLISSFWLTLDWQADYKGHRIHFQNHPFLGERLYIDGVQVAKGGLGLRKTLRGTIEQGDGAGERITADSVAGPREFSVRVVAQAFR
jgi:hypothetical protein